MIQKNKTSERIPFTAKFQHLNSDYATKANPNHIFFENPLANFPIFIYICISKTGGVAQLARARDWQSRGQGFDSPHLHVCYTNIRRTGQNVRFFCFY